MEPDARADDVPAHIADDLGQAVDRDIAVFDQHADLGVLDDLAVDVFGQAGSVADIRQGLDDGASGGCRQLGFLGILSDGRSASVARGIIRRGAVFPDDRPWLGWGLGGGGPTASGQGDHDGQDQGKDDERFDFHDSPPGEKDYGVMEMTPWRRVLFPAIHRSAINDL